MTLDFNAFAVLFVFLPFLAAVVAPIISREAGTAAGWILAIVPAGMFIAFLNWLPSVAAGTPVVLSVNWVPALGLPFTLRVDGLSLVFALMITGIGAFIAIYAGSYLGGDPRRGRFFAALFAFMGAMLGLVLSDSFPALFAFWELTSVTSFLLIGYDTERKAARRAALQAMLVTGLGGLALLAAGVILRNVGGTWSIAALQAYGGPLRVSDTYLVVLALVAIAAFTKSAQVPFHFWLPNAMEAPTPVSAYLHSATMVQGGVYLLARLSPLLGGTPAWTVLLVTLGGATLLWGGLVALQRTDLKQILAQSTLAALGIETVILGVGGEEAAAGFVAFFVGHALYKAALFLIAGILDHQTGTREIDKLGGLRDHLTITFIAAGAAALSMFGLPPLMGYFAKEAVYGGLGLGSVAEMVVVVLLVVGNALVGVAALTVVIRPFMGELKPELATAKESPMSLWVGPVAFGLAALGIVFVVEPFAEQVLGPAASAITGHQVEAHLTLWPDVSGPTFWLSVVTWVLAIGFYRERERVFGRWRMLHLRWTADRAFDALYFGLVRIAGAFTRTTQHGRLDVYLVLLVSMLALTLLVPLWSMGAWPDIVHFGPINGVQVIALITGVIGVLAVGLARTRLQAIILLGIQGVAISLIFAATSGPDLAMTQLIVEVLSVVVLALVMTRLKLSVADPRGPATGLRDAFLAISCGVGVTAMLLRVVEEPFSSRLSDFYAASSAALAHGHNIVNVIIVDFRGLDTLGEITVVMAAAIGIVAMLRRQQRHGQVLPDPEAEAETQP